MDPRDVLIETARQFYARDWMLGTSGNLSLRLPDGSLWITASGRSKGNLCRRDLLRVSPTGAIVEREDPQARPSAETSIHIAIYSLFPNANACFHVHTVAANVACIRRPGPRLALPPLEMIKGFDIWAPAPQVGVDVLKNLPHVPDIAAEVTRRYQESPPEVPGFLIEHHGLTTWGPDAETTRNRVELFEFLFRVVVAT